VLGCALLRLPSSAFRRVRWALRLTKVVGAFFEVAVEQEHGNRWLCPRGPGVDERKRINLCSGFSVSQLTTHAQALCDLLDDVYAMGKVHGAGHD
jgi:hypothetical protein